MAYSWRPEEVFRLLGMSVPNRNEIYIECPFCGSKRFGFNMLKGIGKCWSCSKGADSAQYYAVATGQSLNEARYDIERRIGIRDDNGKKRGENEIPQRIVYKRPEIKEEVIASPELLDDAYRAFLAELSLNQKNHDHLLSRGMSEQEFLSRLYRTFPTWDKSSFFSICRRLQIDGHLLKGVPGFFKYNGDYTFVRFTPGILMPLVNYQNQITGLQLRKDDDLRVIKENGELEDKCAWFSSPNRDGGAGVIAGVHYACDFIYDKEAGCYKPVFEDGFMLTEGIMKADIAHMCQPNIPVISVPGVNATTQLETELKRLASWGVKTILVCFDMDYKTNPNVQNALKKVNNLIEACGMKVKQGNWETHVTVGGETYNLNGIDDYLVFAKYGIVPHVKIK